MRKLALYEVKDDAVIFGVQRKKGERLVLPPALAIHHIDLLRHVETTSVTETPEPTKPKRGYHTRPKTADEP